MYVKLVTKVVAIASSKFILKTQYNTNKSGLEKEIDDVDANKLLRKHIIILRSMRLKVKFLVLRA